jgi:iron complex outermembrane receptor protein
LSNDNLGTSYRSIGNIQTEYKNAFLPALKAVANFGYDHQLVDHTGRRMLISNGPRRIGHTLMKNTATRNNKLMDLFLNYNNKISLISTQVDVTGGYSYQDLEIQIQALL